MLGRKTKKHEFDREFEREFEDEGNYECAEDEIEEFFGILVEQASCLLLIGFLGDVSYKWRRTLP
jgi:hypothetical protein